MTAPRIQHDARASWALEKIAEAVEEELDRLRRARPHLEDRIDRAAGILVTQLSSAAKTRPIRCRIRKDGKRVYLVASLSAGGATYLVDPVGWNCSCPDHQRRDAMCKHVAASWVLGKVGLPRRANCADCGESFHPDRLLEVGEGEAEETLRPGERVCRLCAPKHGLAVPRQKGCDACQGGWVHLTEEIVDTTTGELVEATNTVRCRRCLEKPPEQTLSDEEMARWMDESRWIFAKTYADSFPHSYCLRRHQDPERFDSAARTIWHLGWDRMFLQRPWRTMDVGDFILWVHTMPKPGMAYPRDTVLINRAPRIHERQPGRRA